MQKPFYIVLLAAAFGSLTTLSCALLRGMDRAQDQVHAALPVSVFFQANLPDDQTRATADQLKAQDPAIEETVYTSRDQAFADASKDPLLSRSLMLLRDNPLSAVVEVRYSKKAWLERQDPAQALHQVPGIQEIRWSAARREMLLQFEPWKKICSKTLWIVCAVLMLWSLKGIRAFAVTLSEWKIGMTFILAGFIGGACTLFLWSLVLPGQTYPALPLLFGGLLGVGSFQEKCA